MKRDDDEAVKLLAKQEHSFSATLIILIKYLSYEYLYMACNQKGRMLRISFRIQFSEVYPPVPDIYLNIQILRKVKNLPGDA